MKNIVLIVDDDVVSRMVLMHLVDGCGNAEIVEAEDGAEAWALIEGGLRPSICFCDLRMPKMSGMELLRHVRGHEGLAGMPFVLVTSASDAETLEQARDFGAAGFVVKPFQTEEVREYMATIGPTIPPEPPASTELPFDTMQRLGIGNDRLLAYLGGLAAQLDVAGEEVASMLARSEPDNARVRLDKLQAGCSTLGLHAHAAHIAACPLELGRLRQVLADASQAVRLQATAVAQTASS